MDAKIKSAWLRRVKERLSRSYITSSPSPSKERGIKGVRFVNNLLSDAQDKDKGGGSKLCRLTSTPAV